MFAFSSRHGCHYRAVSSARTGINRLLILVMRRERGGGHIFPGANARINKTAFPQPVQSIEVKISTFALEIRPFIPFQSEPLQILNNRLSKLRPAPPEVEILNSQK